MVVEGALFIVSNVGGFVTTRIAPVGTCAFLFFAGGLADFDFLFLTSVFSLLAGLSGVACGSSGLSSLSGDACDRFSSLETNSSSFFLISSLEPRKKGHNTS